MYFSILDDVNSDRFNGRILARKLVVVEKFEFERREVFLKMTVFYNFGLSNIKFLHQNQQFLNDLLVALKKLSDMNLIEEIESVKVWNVGFRNREGTSTKLFSGNFGPSKIRQN